MRRAAEDTRKEDAFLDDKKLQKLKLSDSWVHGFLKRGNLRRRRITGVSAPLLTCTPPLHGPHSPFHLPRPLPPPLSQRIKADRPSVEDVRTHMAGLQAQLAGMGFEPREITNVDETPGIIGLQNSYAYGAARQQRTSAPADPNEKNRITAIVGFTGSGDPLPAAHIIRNSIAGPDQSSQRVLTALLQDLGGNAAGWELFTWQRVVRVSGKTQIFTRPYLIHIATGRVIWSQIKAYQDTAGLIMYLELVLKPYKERIGAKRIALVWDNCASHLNDSVLAAHAAADVHIFPLIRDMTDRLQPVDIIGNGPLKAAQRRYRANELYDHHQNYVADCHAALASKRPLPNFNPPRSTLPSFLLMHHKIWDETFGAEAFRAAVRRVFIAVGICPDGCGTYKVYSSHEDATFVKSKRLFKFVGLSDPPNSTCFLASAVFELDYEEDDELVDEDDAERADDFLALLNGGDGMEGSGGGALFAVEGEEGGGSGLGDGGGAATTV